MIDSCSQACTFLYHTIGVQNANMNTYMCIILTLWSGVLTLSPGFTAFGYTNSGACTVNSSMTVRVCSDLAHVFYWIPG